MKDRRLVFARGYGLADQASSRIVTPNSLFRIMSISKSITVTAIMKLIFSPSSTANDNTTPE